MIKKICSGAAAGALLVALLATFAFPQPKEKPRKPDAETMSAAPAPQSSDKEKEEKNEGDPLFKGMKYRPLVRTAAGGR
ncbi:MAG: hypothetical protein ACHP7J_02125 [Terriglobales bacterium]